MNPVWIIAKRELKSFFDSLTAYILLIAFLGFTGAFTWLFLQDVFFVGQASMQSFFNVAYFTLFFFIPALTMRQLAEEKRSGTIELLLTKSVSDRSLVMGKFLATLLLILIALAFTLPYYFSIARLAAEGHSIDHGAVWSGYLGLILMSASYISIGIFASSSTNNQIVAFLMALLIGVLFHFVFSWLTIGGSRGIWGEFFNYLSMNTHFESISRGVIDTKDLLYFLSIVIIGLLLAEFNIRNRN